MSNMFLLDYVSERLFLIDLIDFNSPHYLKFLIISFFFLSIIGFKIPWKIPRPSSRYKPVSLLCITGPSTSSEEKKSA